MPDRITQLERLNRLRAEGGLSEEEFRREKQRLLGRNAKRTWLFAGIGVGTTAIIVLTLVTRAPAPQTASAASATMINSAESTEPIPPARSAAPPIPNISSRIRIADGGCHFAPDLERAFANMLHRDGDSVRPREVRFGTIRLTPSVSSARDEGVNLPNFRQYESVVAFNEPVLWNGLRLIGLRAATGWEWESLSMEFADNPTRVRNALQRMGIRIPESGLLHLPGDECPSSIAVTAQGTGAAMSCGGGC